MGNKINVEDLPRVPEWVSLPEVADSLKLSRQQIHRMAASGQFESLSRIGTYMVISSIELIDLSLKRGLDTEI